MKTTDDVVIKAMLALTEHNIPPDIQELLIYGNQSLGVEPGAILAALAVDLSEKEHWQKWAQKRVEIQRKHWLRAAKAALDGDTRELRNRVELSEAEPMEIIQSTSIGPQ